jgi:hypothetical protein
MDITVTQGSTELASGDLEVDTSTTPPTGTFTPTDGYEVDGSGEFLVCVTKRRRELEFPS